LSSGRVLLQVTKSKSKARSVTLDRVYDAGLLRREPGVTPVRSFRDIRLDMGL